MKGFSLGRGLHVDLDALVDTRLLVQANSGGGKSWCLRRLLEQTHGGVQHLVIDPEGEFASLREKFDYVLAAKKGGETLADPRSAKLLAERLLELRISAIIDIYELKAHERIRFVRLFLEALVDAPKKLWHPALVVVDEAHVYCPEKGNAESAGAVIDLATRGRKRGFCAVLATQRISKLHKDAAAECNNKLIGRSALDIDMKRSADELGLSGREDTKKLRTLEAGEFYSFGPAFTPTQVNLVKVGAVQTTHPKAGARLAFAAPPPTEKVRALLPKLADLPAEAEERQHTIEDLRKELANARRELTLAQRAQPQATPRTVEKVVEKRIEVPVLKDAQLTKLKAAVDRMGDVADRLVSVGGDLRGFAGAIVEALRNGRPRPIVSVKSAPGLHTLAEMRAMPEGTTVRSPVDGDFMLSGPQQRILDALAWLETIGISPATREAVGFLSGYRPTSGRFANLLGGLRTADTIEYPQGGTVALTDFGRAHAQAPNAPMSVDELHRLVLQRLSNPEGKVLAPLLSAYPQSLSREELAEASGYRETSGRFANLLGTLRSLGIVDYPEPGRVVALGVLFLEGT